MTVLLVDDDPNVLAAVEGLLQVRGHTVWVAHDPDDARFVLAEHSRSPDVLLTDIVFPGQDGLAYARGFKEAHPAIRIVFMTALPHWEPAALRTGLGRVIRKPFSADTLYRAVEEP